jgi:hypothetical protein
MKRRILIAAVTAAAWLCAMAVSPSGKAAAQAAGHSLLLIHSANGNYAIAGRRDLPAPMPRAKASAVHQGWSYQALNASGAVLHIGELPNPHVLRGDFHDAASDTTTGVALTSSAPVTFSIRVPAGTESIVLYDTPIPVPAGLSAAARAAASSAIVARIDL